MILIISNYTLLHYLSLLHIFVSVCAWKLCMQGMNGNLFGVSDADPNKNIQNPPNMWRSSTTETDFFFTYFEAIWTVVDNIFQTLGDTMSCLLHQGPKWAAGHPHFFPTGNWAPGKTNFHWRIWTQEMCRGNSQAVFRKHRFCFFRAPRSPEPQMSIQNGAKSAQSLKSRRKCSYGFGLLERCSLIIILRQRHRKIRSCSGNIVVSHRSICPGFSGGYYT